MGTAESKTFDRQFAEDWHRVVGLEVHTQIQRGERKLPHDPRSCDKCASILRRQPERVNESDNVRY